jgi:hypothetical protein
MGIQLLEPNNCPTIQSPKMLEYDWQHRTHLVASSADGTHIAMAQQEGSVVTMLDTFQIPHNNSLMQICKFWTSGLLATPYLWETGTSLSAGILKQESQYMMRL